MTINIGYPPADLLSGSKQSRPITPAGEQFAPGANYPVNFVTDPASGLVTGYLGPEGEVYLIGGNGAIPSTLTGPSVSGVNGVGNILTGTNGTATGAASSEVQWFRGNDPIEGAVSLSYTQSEKDYGQYLRMGWRGVNAQGKAKWLFSPSVGPIRGTGLGSSESAPTPIVTFLNAVQGQWVRENLIQNCVDRSIAGDYCVVFTTTGGTGASGSFQARKRFSDGSFSAPVTIATNETDDHNVPGGDQLNSGKIIAAYARHGLDSFIRYKISATPHEIDFGTPGVGHRALATSDICTYSQIYVVGNRVVLMYRVGTSSSGAWMLRYCDNIGAAIGDHIWSAEIPITPGTYMDSSRDGNTLRCATYEHPYSTGSHNIYTFDIDLVTGVMTQAGTGSNIGNAYTNTVATPVANMRAAVVISTGTSRLFNIDKNGTVYAMEMAGGNGTTNWPSGTYYRYLRTSGTGPYTKQAICPTGLPFLASQQGYYGGISRLDDNRVECSVNVGVSVGVGSWEKREYLTTDGGNTWTLVSTYESSAIIMRTQVLNNLKFWYEANPYVTYTNFQAEGRCQVSTTAQYAARPSRPAAPDPNPGASLTISGTPPSGTVGTPYSFIPAADGGTAPYTFALTGTLPDGLSFSTSTGTITGTPTTDGTTSGLNITVTDSVSASAALGAFSIVVSTSPGGFAPVTATTLTKVTDIGNNQYRANSDAGSQGAIVWTGQKATGEFEIRMSYVHADCSYICGIGTSTNPTALSTTKAISAQTTAAGNIQYSLSGGTAIVVRNAAFPTRDVNNVFSVYRVANGDIFVRYSTNGGTSWSTPVMMLNLTGDVFIHFYASYSVGIGRVIDNPVHQGLVAV